jgi:hypothetical protein
MASAFVGVTAIAVKTRPEFGLTELQEMSGSASRAIPTTARIARTVCIKTKNLSYLTIGRRNKLRHALRAKALVSIDSRRHD